MIQSLKKKKKKHKKNQNATHWQYLWWFIQVKHYYNAKYSEPHCRRNKMAHSGSQRCVIRAPHSPIYRVFPHVMLTGMHKKNYRISICSVFQPLFLNVVYGDVVCLP